MDSGHAWRLQELLPVPQAPTDEMDTCTRGTYHLRVDQVEELLASGSDGLFGLEAAATEDRRRQAEEDPGKKGLHLWRPHSIHSAPSQGLRLSEQQPYPETQGHCWNRSRGPCPSVPSKACTLSPTPLYRAWPTALKTCYQITLNSYIITKWMMHQSSEAIPYDYKIK